MTSQPVAGPSTGSSNSYPEEKSQILTSTQTHDLFKKLKKELQGSERQGKFEKELKKQITAGSFVPQKAIIFGLGNFTGGGMDLNSEWLKKNKPSESEQDRRKKQWKEDRTKRIRQLVFFLDVQRIVTSTSKSKKKLQVFAQDPEFGMGDLEFLKDLDIAILQAPSGNDAVCPNTVGPDTITYSAFLPYPQTLDLITRCSQHGPAIHIGSDLSGMMAKRVEVGRGGDEVKTWNKYKATHKIIPPEDPSADRSAYIHVRTSSGGSCKECVRPSGSRGAT
ncbi:hypothetical protein LTR37_020652 [Vermiconidia calcicola]|uniref:Uncharacterized protein n=1 Tax=Vermiconidia calcicola TaxID=1690605 RepID=A0ACC3MAW5_9PEZI|nr:hypothetical protein LTR37_020652 [Vermiconidia calcicola]